MLVNIWSIFAWFMILIQNSKDENWIAYRYIDIGYILDESTCMACVVIRFPCLMPAICLSLSQRCRKHAYKLRSYILKKNRNQFMLTCY